MSITIFDNGDEYDEEAAPRRRRERPKFVFHKCSFDELQADGKVVVCMSLHIIFDARHAPRTTLSMGYGATTKPTPRIDTAAAV